MPIKRQILFLLLASINLLSAGQGNLSDNLLKQNIGQFGQVIVTIPYSGIPSMTGLTRNVSITSVKDKKVFITLTTGSVEWFISQNFDYTIVERAQLKGVITAADITDAMEWHSYPSYSQYDSIMHYFSTSFPAICKLDTIGKSINGRYVFALKISDNAGTDEDEPEVFYSSTIHGDELAGFVLMLRLADYLTENYNGSPEVKDLINGLEIWINPLANPDGTYTSGNVITYPTRGNAEGIDLNRNFPDPFLSSMEPEKETIDMVSFMKKHNFVLSANFHSGSEVVNYPWDRWYNRIHADNNWFNTISREYADTVHLYSGPIYMNDLDNGVTRGAEWYVIYGGRQDYITYERQGREVTIELDNTKETPAAQLEMLWQYNYRSLINYLKNAFFGIHGLVSDYHTNAKIKAKVFILNHDKDSSHVYSDSISGRFIRLLSAGLYDLKFSSPGYRDTVITGINIEEGRSTNITVFMKSFVNNIDSGIEASPFIYPNPATGRVSVQLPGTIFGSVDVNLFDMTGREVLNLKTFFIKSQPKLIDLSGIPAGVYAIVFRSDNPANVCRGKLVLLK